MKEQVLALHVKLLKVGRSVGKAVDAWAPMPAGLSMSRFAVLETLFHKGPLCQRELAGKVLKSKGNISILVDRMTRDGLLHRVQDSSDRRHVLVSLSDEGKAAFESYFPSHVDSLRRAYEALSADEIKELSGLLKKLGHSIERDLSQREY